MNVKPITTRVALMAVLALVLTACGSSTQESADQSELGDIGAVEFTDSFPIPDCTGQDSESCTYGGFDPAVDGFSFARSARVVPAANACSIREPNSGSSK